MCKLTLILSNLVKFLVPGFNEWLLSALANKCYLYRMQEVQMLRTEIEKTRKDAKAINVTSKTE